ncbi:MAG: DUF547 domain-containing protein, partial [bacterium]
MVYVVVYVMAGFDKFEALFAPDAELWPRWQAHDPTSNERIDHAQWGTFLRAYVEADGAGIHRIPYDRVSPEHLALLERYLARMEAVPISRYAREEQFAYWINLYNAATVRLVLAHYPLESILKLDISPGWFSFGPWEKKLLTIEGERLSLGDIEHRILRPIWRDARVHYAVSCLALGCPNLPARPLTRENSEALLEAGARTYVNHPRGARVEGGLLTVSKIYNWFSADFGGNPAEVIAHLKRYADPP